MTSRLAALRTSAAGRARMKPQPPGPLFFRFVMVLWLLSRRETDLDSKSRRIIGERDSGSMKLRDRCDKA